MLKKFIFFIFLIQIQSLCSQHKDKDTIPFFKQLNKIHQVDSSIVYIKNILTYNKNKNTHLNANFILGQIYKKKKNNSLSKKYLRRAAVLAKKLGNKKKLAQIYMNNAFNFYLLEGDSAYYYYEEALSISKKINYNSKLTSKIYSNMARLYKKEGDTINAIKFYQKSISIGKKSDRNLCTVYNNFGSLYEKKNMDSTIFYYKKSLDIAKIRGSKKGLSNKYKKDFKLNELRSYVNLAGVFFKDTSSYNNAYENLIKAKEISKKFKSSKYTYYTNFYLGKYYQLTNQTKKAEQYYNLITHSKDFKNEDELQIEILKQLSDFYKNVGNYKKALFFLNRYHQIDKKIYSIEKNMAFNQIKTKYEVAEKDSKINLLTKEKEIEEAKKKSVFLVSIIILTILLFFTYLLKNRIKIQKVLREKEYKAFLQEIQTKKALSLIEGQENERKRLSKELHDGLGGQLSGIKSMIQTITPNNLMEKKTNIDTYLSTSIKNLRNISHDLSANFLENDDFDKLIYQQISQTFETFNIEIEVSIFPTEEINELPKHYKLNIYRIIQEVTQNIIKHANATYVSISVSLHTDISILIEDNGVGFNTKGKSNGIGLQNIKDRLHSIQGTLYIDSQLKKGTTININIPIYD